MRKHFNTGWFNGKVIRVDVAGDGVTSDGCVERCDCDVASDGRVERYYAASKAALRVMLRCE